MRQGLVGNRWMEEECSVMDIWSHIGGGVE